MPVSQKGVYLFYNPSLINFFISNMLGEKEKQKQAALAVGAHANDVNKLIDWLIFL